MNGESEVRYVRQGEVVGKKVVEQRGYIVGEVKDLSFKLSEDRVELALTIKYGDTERDIPWSQVKSIGDVVLLKVEYEPPVKAKPEAAKPEVTAPPLVAKPQPAPLTPKICPNCGYPNDPKNRFCIKCGTKLPE
ncbi:MAG: zinc-ribbon domain-containing protein [Candidatus Bathyarchaeota archaeon]|nr:zinc-ribbon domain-containing protein [Candidatus Bathyarchaeota archaeon]